jgi:hypothetical protein
MARPNWSRPIVIPKVMARTKPTPAELSRMPGHKDGFEP